MAEIIATFESRTFSKRHLMASSTEKSHPSSHRWKLSLDSGQFRCWKKLVFCISVEANLQEFLCKVYRTMEQGQLFNSGSRPRRSHLNDQNGPEGCIPPGPNTFRISITSNLPLGRKTLKIHLPTFRFVIYTESIHKVNETVSRVLRQVGRCLIIYLDNLLIVYIKSRQRPVTADNSIDLPAIWMLRPNSQSQEICTRPNQGAGISPVWDSHLLRVSELTNGACVIWNLDAKRGNFEEKNI